MLIIILFFSVLTGDCGFFSDEERSWGYARLLPHTKLKEDGFLENDKLTIEVYMNAVEVINEGNITANEMATVHDFDVFNSQVSQGATDFLFLL